MAKIFTLKFDSLTGTFDDGPLQEFLTHKEVLSLREHFFVKDEIPYLTIVAHYTMPPLITTGGNAENQRLCPPALRKSRGTAMPMWDFRGQRAESLSFW